METGPIGLNKKKDPVKFYPKLRLEHESFPEAKKWEVGKTYKIELEVKMTGLSISKFQNDSEFEIIGFGCEDEMDDKSEKEEGGNNDD